MNQSLLGQLEDIRSMAKNAQLVDSVDSMMTYLDDIQNELSVAIDLVKRIDKHHTDLGALLS